MAASGNERFVLGPSGFKSPKPKKRPRAVQKGSAELLHAGDLSIAVDQRLKNGKDMTAVYDHALESVAQAGLALRFTVPAREDVRRHLNVPAQLFG